MTNIGDFYLKFFSFLEVKCSIYLNRLVFVMPLLSGPMLMCSLIRAISVCRQAPFSCTLHHSFVDDTLVLYVPFNII